MVYKGHRLNRAMGESWAEGVGGGLTVGDW